MRTRTFSIVASALLTLAPYQSSLAQDFQTLMDARNRDASALALSPIDIPYRHRVTIHEIEEEDGQKMEFKGSFHVEPSAPVGDRVTVSEGENSFSDNSLEEIELLNEKYTSLEIAEDFWCPSGLDKDFNQILTAPDTEVLDENSEFVTLKVGTKTMLQTIFDGDEDDMPRKIRKRMDVKLTLSKPDLTTQRIQMALSRPTKIKVIAKIKKFEIDIKCQTAPNGFPYASETNTYIHGKALGSEFRSKAKTSISQLERTY